MTSRHLNPLVGFGFCFLFCLLSPLPTYSDCIAPINNCTFDTIGTDSFVVSCDYNSNAVFTDTITKTGQLQDMKREFDSSTYCFLGAVDSVIRFRTAPDGNPCHMYDVDSVHVKIKAVYKGAAISDYWFLDTLVTRSCDTNLIIWIEDPDPGYSSIKATDFIAFTDIYGSLRKSNVTTSACFALTGYFLDRDSNIIKDGFLSIKTSPYFLPIEYSAIWIKMPLIDFVNYITSVNQARFIAPKSAATKQGRRTVLKISRGSDYPVDAYDIRGRRIRVAVKGMQVIIQSRGF